jgi:hypothetical protein
VCLTDKFKLQGGGTLGPPLDANCSIATRVDYVYRSKADGKLKPLTDPKTTPADAEMVELPAVGGSVLGTRIPFIVRIETGTINRGIYQIAVLSNPATEPTIDPMTRPAAWNGRLNLHLRRRLRAGLVSAGRFDRRRRRRRAAAPGIRNRIELSQRPGKRLQRRHHCRDDGDDEGALHRGLWCARIHDRLGLVWSSVQQHEIGENYPGLLDGLMTGRSFADGTFSSSTSSGEGRLFEHYFDKVATQKYTDDQIIAVTGFPVVNTMHNLSRVRAPRFNPTESCPEELASELRYHPVKNPKGARCDMWDHSANVYGRDPKTGFARRPLDNVGIQYGLGALNAGKISKEQFLDINEKIGGFDIDGNMVVERMVADPIATRAAYRTGRLNQTGGGMSSVPIIDYRTYYDDLPGGDVHMRFQTFTTTRGFRRPMAPRTTA